jgi:hypothetical protein
MIVLSFFIVVGDMKFRVRALLTLSIETFPRFFSEGCFSYESDIPIRSHRTDLRQGKQPYILTHLRCGRKSISFLEVKIIQVQAIESNQRLAFVITGRVLDFVY